MRRAASTSRIYRIPTATGTSTTSAVSGVPIGASREHPNTENAVYAYMQAKRSLGATRVNSAEIANALGLPQRQVEAAVSRMGDRGVKVL